MQTGTEGNSVFTGDRNVGASLRIVWQGVQEDDEPLIARLEVIPGPDAHVP